MFGALFLFQQTFNRQQLHAGKFLAVGTFVKTFARRVCRHSFRGRVERNEQRDLRVLAFARTDSRSISNYFDFFPLK